MKIILIAPPGSFTEQLKKAFIKNRTDVLYVNDREIKILPFLKKNVVLWRIIRRLSRLRVINNKLFNRDLISLCRREKPDLLFVNKGMIIHPRTLKETKLMGIKTANWFLDNVYHPRYRDWFVNNSRHYDYFFIFDSSARQLVKSGGSNIIYLPMAIDVRTYNVENISLIDRDKYSCNICFIGALYPERERLLNEVKDLGLKIFGWHGWEKSSLAPYYYGPLNIEESAKLYKCAKICLNVNLEPAAAGVNLKTFEIPAAGGFQLSDYRTDIEGLFSLGKEIEIFRNKDELRQKVIFYLAHENLRVNIALAGKERTLREHTLEKRVADILKIVGYNKNTMFK